MSSWREKKPSVHQPISYVIDSTVLDCFVISDERTQSRAPSSRLCRPWLTVCLEPVSHLPIAHMLRLDPPDRSLYRDLVHKALTCPHVLPAGSIPDSIWLDGSGTLLIQAWQPLFCQISIKLCAPPSGTRAIGAVERMLAALRNFLHAHLSCAHVGAFPHDALSEEVTPCTLAQLERYCAQWMAFSHSSASVTADALCRRMRHMDLGSLQRLCEQLPV
jgi:hypothetical protein